MQLKKYDMSWLKKIPKPLIYGFLFGFSLSMIISQFTLSYSFFAGILGALIFLGIYTALINT